MRIALAIAILTVFVAGLSAGQDAFFGTKSNESSVIQKYQESGDVALVLEPRLTDVQSARQLASRAAEILIELNDLPNLTPELVKLRQAASFAAEFMKGDCYDLATCKVNSVVTLREKVKIPPPEGLVYVRKYKNVDEMPPFVARLFQKEADKRFDGSPQGLTIQGRFIAIIVPEYHSALEDIFAHELVHAYITLACPKVLPHWFQEGAAVYFSTGTSKRLHYKVGENKIVETTLPEDYKRNLFSFQYIENQAGKDGLYEFVRKSVMTGDVDSRSALGLDPAEPPAERKYGRLVVPAIVAAFILVIALIIYMIRHDGEWG